jgi:ribonuclease BN (tRNA processing enzyme)
MVLVNDEGRNEGAAMPRLKGSWAALFFAGALTAMLAAAPAAAAQKTKLILLGTAGGPAVYTERSEPANLLIVDGRAYLIDVGYGAVLKLVAAGVSPIDVDAVFITHHHLDHNGDLGSLLNYQWAGGRMAPTEVYGPLGTERLLKAAVDYLSVPADVFGPQMPLAPKPATIMRAHEVTKDGLVYKDKWIKVTAAENSHFVMRNKLPGEWRDKSFSYRVETKDRVIVFTGDTGPSEAVVKLARKADILVSEVIDLDGIEQSLRDARGPDGAPLSEEAFRSFYDHLTREHLPADDLGKMAAKAQVKMVVLSHLVVQPGGDTAVVEKLAATVRAHYDGPVVVGNDLDTF